MNPLLRNRVGQEGTFCVLAEVEPLTLREIRPPPVVFNVFPVHCARVIAP